MALRDCREAGCDVKRLASHRGKILCGTVLNVGYVGRLPGEQPDNCDMLRSSGEFRGKQYGMIGKWLKGLFGRAQPQRDEFVQLLLRHLQVQFPGDVFEYDEKAFSVRRSSGGNGSLFINLANLYTDYCHTDRAGRAAIVAAFLASAKADPLPATLAEARTQLLPVIRSINSLDLLPGEDGVITHGDPHVQFGLLPFGAGLGIGIVFDTPHSMIHVGREQIEKWQVSAQAALDIALDNLRHKAAPQFASLAPGMYVSRYDDLYDATRLLLPELAWQLPLKGTPVAMIPNRGCLILAGDQDEAAIAVMLGLARKVLEEQARPLSAAMFRLSSSGWEAWAPQGAAGNELHNLQRYMADADYATQQSALNTMLEQSGQDVFVANLKLVQKQGSPRIESYAVISRGVSTWVPQCDLLVFNDPESNQILFVPWQIVLAVVPDLLEPLPYVLPRFKVQAFPDQAQLKEMKARTGC